MGEDYRQVLRTLSGIANNPNTGATLIVGLGCEGIQAEELLKQINTGGKPAGIVIIQESGGTPNAIAAGTAKAQELSRLLAAQQREPFPVSELVVGLECGGSDPTSGIAANPAVGAAVDLLLEAGGSSILSETTELIGAEHLLAKRAVNSHVASEIYRIVNRTEQRAIAQGTDIRGTQPTPGNIQGGISTIEEKSLGCIFKAGSADVQAVLEYGEQIPREPKGLFLMDTPGQDIESITGMLAGGAQIVLFTTGRGSPAGSPVAPVIKVTGNHDTFSKMQDNIEINAGTIITENRPVAETGNAIYRELLAVANGKLTKAEVLGHREFAIFRVGYTY